jgi:hypothetical protein
MPNHITSYELSQAKLTTKHDAKLTTKHDAEDVKVDDKPRIIHF